MADEGTGGNGGGGNTNTNENMVPQYRFNEINSERSRYRNERDDWKKKYEEYDVEGTATGWRGKLDAKDIEIAELKGTISQAAVERALEADGLSMDDEVAEYILGRYDRLKVKDGEKKPKFKDWYGEFAKTSRIVKTAIAEVLDDEEDETAEELDEEEEDSDFIEEDEEETPREKAKRLKAEKAAQLKKKRAARKKKGGKKRKPTKKKKRGDGSGKVDNDKLRQMSHAEYKEWRKGRG